MIPRFKPFLGREEFCALFTAQRGDVRRFEEAFANSFGAADAVSFPYGRSALWAFLKAMGLQNVEVIMPAYTCSVVAHAISLSGNRPVFVDICLSDYNMDLDLLQQNISKETRAVVATHLFGYPMNLDRLEEVISEAEKKYGHKIWLIQDCAHSFGAEWNGRQVSNSGDIALYALNISKMMTSIFGGMLTFKSKDLAERVRIWRDNRFVKAGFFKLLLRRLYLMAVYGAFNEKIYGMTWYLQEKTPILDRLTKAWHLDEKIHFPPDAMEKMLDVEAAVGLEQLKKYPQIIAMRREMAAKYDKILPRNEGWIFPPLVEGATYSHYVVRVPERESVVRAYARKGIHLGELIQYSVPLLPEYRKERSNCPNAALASMHTVNFPMSIKF